MGVGTVFKAKEIILMAWGHKKASIIRQTLECNITSDIPATYLQLSDKVQFILGRGCCVRINTF
jgi:glucosamine-6-phosphate deaminase